MNEVIKLTPNNQEFSKKETVSLFISLLYKKVNKGRKPSKSKDVAIKPKNQIKRINKFLMTFPTLISIIHTEDWEKLKIFKFATNINPKRETLLNYGLLCFPNSSLTYAELLDFLSIPEMENFTYNLLLSHKGFPKCCKSIQRIKSNLLPVQNILLDHSNNHMLSRKKKIECEDTTTTISSI